MITTLATIDSDYAFKVHNNLLQAKTLTLGGIFKQGEFLLEIKEKKLWKLLDCQSWLEYLNSPDVSYSEREAQKYIRIYKVFIKELNLPRKDLEEIGVSKLELLASYITKENSREMLEKGAMTRIDLLKDLGKIPEIQERTIKNMALVSRLTDFLENKIFPQYAEVKDLIAASKKISKEILKCLNL